MCLRLIIIALLLSSSGCGGRSALGEPTEDSSSVRPVDGSTVQRDLKSWDLAKGDLGKKDGAVPIVDIGFPSDVFRPDACSGPWGEPIYTYAGTYSAQWGGTITCADMAAQIKEEEGELLIDLTKGSSVTTLAAHGIFSHKTMKALQGEFSGTMNCFALTGKLEIGVGKGKQKLTLTGTIEGVFAPTSGVPPHFGDGTWSAENPALGCKANGTWKGTW
jgi:hypothetical protein